MSATLPNPIRTLLAGSLAALVVGALAGAPAAAAPAVADAGEPIVAPHIAGVSTVPVYSYADAIRESVWVQSPVDADLDGISDRIAVDIVRPREAAQIGVRVPVIMDASPYYQCCGRGNENELKQYATDGTVTRFPLFYDNYFVPRGFAFAAVDLAGTSRSTGCEDVGGRGEVAGAKAVIDWLNGRAPGFAADGSAVSADWTTGTVGMIGKSWDGTIANAVAATGVQGLATVVPISAISSWYDYTRIKGLLRARQYPAFLHNFVTGRPVETCASTLAALRSDSAEDTGNYNAFWRERDYRATVAQVRASVFIAHGVGDLNVRTSQFARWWGELAQRGVPRKIWLYQAGHEDPFDVRRAEWVATLHRWFDRWLQGLPNGIDSEPRLSLETEPGVWTDEPDWPAPAGAMSLALGAGDGVTGTLGGPAAPAATVQSYRDESLRETALVSQPTTPRAGRLVYLSAPLSVPLRISGSPSVRLRIKVDRPTTGLTARLVDYGTATRVDHFSSEGVRTLTTESCWGESTAADDACYRDTAENLRTADTFVCSRGWMDAGHFLSLRDPIAPVTRVNLRPDLWYNMLIPMEANDTVIPAGHVLGLVLGQSDPGFTVANDTDATVQVDLTLSTLTIPAIGSVQPGNPALAPLTGTPAEPNTDPVPVDTIWQS